MNPVNSRQALLENLAAELTVAAYPVMLRRGLGLQWLDVQLELWRALTEKIARLDGTLALPEEMHLRPRSGSRSTSGAHDAR
jgi:hypothetical protein